eukprot:CAMPEP_0181207936 /NCGR_PEP_ID=MMETSP1096-20121128/21854_1 /TAXON_ID=156174 ORGANISM="Chrysochromulina ericina, Strain CCMP281" /NCGR_SAMPLE_ID=MMETSP1096 /ASSEMBLY_ACC=CAM_ASM_000453 /LENGTH=204 /DNA_ID=CAMNT_0023298975 /DNA_START=245 /DNA_END=860 /DNA_ORIENTATION=+
MHQWRRPRSVPYDVRGSRLLRAVFLAVPPHQTWRSPAVRPCGSCVAEAASPLPICTAHALADKVVLKSQQLPALLAARVLHVLWEVGDQEFLSRSDISQSMHSYRVTVEALGNVGRTRVIRATEHLEHAAVHLAHMECIRPEDTAGRLMGGVANESHKAMSRRWPTAGICLYNLAAISSTTRPTMATAAGGYLAAPTLPRAACA